MRFYVVTIQIGNGVIAQSITKAEGVDNEGYQNALQMWHHELDYCRTAKTLDKDTCIILNENGDVICSETWINPNQIAG